MRMFESFVLTSKRDKANQFLKAIKAEVPGWRDELDRDFLDYMMLSESAPNHSNDILEVIYAEILLPMMAGNYIILRDGDKAVAYASWGFFSKEVSNNKLTARRSLLTKDDYDTGREIWLMDVIAPHGHAKQIIAELVKRKHDLGLHDDRIHFRRSYAQQRSQRFNSSIC